MGQALWMGSWIPHLGLSKSSRNRFEGDSWHQIDDSVASFSVGTRNKDLDRGNSIHDDYVQRGWFEKGP